MRQRLLTGSAIFIAALLIAVLSVLPISLYPQPSSFPPSSGGSMVYPSTGVPQSTGTAWSTSLTLDTDGTLAGNSDTHLATQKAAKTYIDAHSISALSWTGFVYSNSFADFGSGLQTGQWAKNGYGIVRFRGVLKPGGTCGANTTIFTLPVGARPVTASIVGFLYDNTNFESVNVGTDGVISLRETLGGCTASDYISVEGVSFSTN